MRACDVPGTGELPQADEAEIAASMAVVLKSLDQLGQGRPAREVIRQLADEYGIRLRS